MPVQRIFAAPFKMMEAWPSNGFVMGWWGDPKFIQ